MVTTWSRRECTVAAGDVEAIGHLTVHPSLGDGLEDGSAAASKSLPAGGHFRATRAPRWTRVARSLPNGAEPADIADRWGLGAGDEVEPGRAASAASEVRVAYAALRDATP